MNILIRIEYFVLETGVDAQIAKLQTLWEEAMKSGDGKKAIALKNQIFDLNTKKNLGLIK